MALSTDSQQLQFKDVELIHQELILDEFFKVNRFTFRHRLFAGGQSKEIERIVYQRGCAVAVLPYDPVTEEVVLVEQFRIGAYAAQFEQAQKETPWLLECIAGMVEQDEQATEVAAREADEEAGIAISEVSKMLSVYTSPGGTAEVIHLYAALTDSTTAQGIHGLDYEGEDIRVRTMKLNEAIDMVEQGVINNAPTVIAIQWLQLNKSRWLESLGK